MGEEIVDVPLDDDVVRVLLLVCQWSASCWRIAYTYAIVLLRKVEVFQSGRGEVFRVHTNECWPCKIDAFSVVPLLLFLLLDNALDSGLAVTGGEEIQLQSLLILLVELLLLLCFLLLLLELLQFMFVDNFLLPLLLLLLICFLFQLCLEYDSVAIQFILFLSLLGISDRLLLDSLAQPRSIRQGRRLANDYSDACCVSGVQAAADSYLHSQRLCRASGAYGDRNGSVLPGLGDFDRRAIVG
jgi:hypothetical protein